MNGSLAREMARPRASAPSASPEIVERACHPVLSVNGGFLRQPVTGVQRYGREVLARLIPLVGRENVRVFVPGRERLDLPFPAGIVTTPVRQRAVWTQTVLPGRADGALLSLANIGPLFHRRQVLCVHDLNPFLVPDSYRPQYRVYQKALISILARTAARLTTVSCFSRAMLARHGLADERNVTVIPNGHEHVFGWDGERSRLKEEPFAQDPFVLVVGSLAEHKNVGVLLAGASALGQAGIRLVVAGGPGPFLVSRAAAQGHGSDNVVTLGRVSDDDLAFLFGRAACFAFPSLTEGFGLPALEAMALGCPVVASSAASLPEVCGDAAVYVDPDRPDEWVAAIRAVVSDPARRRVMRDRGFARAKLFSWAASAEAYRNLVGSV